MKKMLQFAAVFALVLLAPGGSASAQVGAGLIDPNVASQADLTALPNMTPAIVKGIMDKRPFTGIVELNTFLLGQGLTAAQTAEIYAKAFIHVNLNTATREEILLIPTAGTRMAREFPEYRPWKNWAQFDKEIGKYVGQAATDRLKQYVFIPMNLNTATDADFQTIPGVGRMVREFKEYRPWKTKEQFEKEIGKYVNAREVARLWRYVVIE
jgi:DNA uptake protein ComE-like DNA-binding protein